MLALRDRPWRKSGISFARLIRAARHLAFSVALFNNRLAISVWSGRGLNSPAVFAVSLQSFVVFRLGDGKGSCQHSMPGSPV